MFCSFLKIMQTIQAIAFAEHGRQNSDACYFHNTPMNFAPYYYRIRLTSSACANPKKQKPKSEKNQPQRTPGSSRAQPDYIVSYAMPSQAPLSLCHAQILASFTLRAVTLACCCALIAYYYDNFVFFKSSSFLFFCATIINVSLQMLASTQFAN